MRLILCKRACVAVLASLSAAAEAAEPGKLFATPATAVTSPSNASSVGQVTLALIVVLAAVFAAAWLVRRLKNFQQGGARSLRIVGQVALGAKERAVLIQVGKKSVLVGVTPASVNALHVFDAEEIADENGGASSIIANNNAAPPSFKSLLRQSLGLK